METLIKQYNAAANIFKKAAAKQKKSPSDANYAACNEAYIKVCKWEAIVKKAIKNQNNR